MEVVNVATTMLAHKGSTIASMVGREKKTSLSICTEKSIARREFGLKKDSGYEVRDSAP